MTAGKIDPSSRDGGEFTSFFPRVLYEEDSQEEEGGSLDNIAKEPLERREWQEGGLLPTCFHDALQQRREAVNVDREEGQNRSSSTLTDRARELSPLDQKKENIKKIKSFVFIVLALISIFSSAILASSLSITFCSVFTNSKLYLKIISVALSVIFSSTVGTSLFILFGQITVKINEREENKKNFSSYLKESAIFFLIFNTAMIIPGVLAGSGGVLLFSKITSSNALKYLAIALPTIGSMDLGFVGSIGGIFGFLRIVKVIKEKKEGIGNKQEGSQIGELVKRFKNSLAKSS